MFVSNGSVCGGTQRVVSVTAISGSIDDNYWDGARNFSGRRGRESRKYAFKSTEKAQKGSRKNTKKFHTMVSINILKKTSTICVSLSLFFSFF